MPEPDALHLPAAGAPSEPAPAEQLPPHIGDHHFALPTVAPVSRPAPAATPQW